MGTIRNILCILLILFFIAGPLLTDDYNDSLAELSSKIKTNLGYKTTAIDDSISYASIREAYNFVSSGNRAKFFIDTITLAEHQWVYALDSQVISVDFVAIQRTDTLWPLSPSKNKNMWSTIKDKPEILRDRDEGRQIPRLYDWRTNYIFISPIPISSEMMIVTGYRNAVNIMTDDELPLQVELTFRDAIEAYATYSLALKKQRYEESKFWKEKYAEKMKVVNTHLNIRDYGRED